LKRPAILLVLTGLSLVVLVACGTGGGQAGPAGVGQGPDDTGSPTGAPPSLDAIQTGWQTSPHADTYVMADDGTNSACARCHAPVNWVPAMDELPASCLVCKFEVQPPPPVIDRVDWGNVRCNVCHQIKDDVVQPEIAWLEVAALEQYAKVDSASELCLKCHATADVPGHKTIVHAGVHQDLDCTACHDAHTTAASCGTADCHPAAGPIPGHDEAHQTVACLACHDASGLAVGPDQSGVWTTMDYASHSLQTTVDCQRCHYAGNPWGLAEVAP